MRLGRETRYVYSVTLGIALLAQVAAAAQEWERAARLFGAVEAQFAVMGSHVEFGVRDEYDGSLAAVRAQLEPDVWERLYREGAAWSLEGAIAYALDEEPGRSG